jgi:hypothetical protein
MVRLTISALLLASAALISAQGTQFITGPCQSDADCASGCCGFNSGKCAGAVIALERDGGCGRGNAQSNDNAARALGFTGDFTPSSGSGASSSTSANTNTNANTNTATNDATANSGATSSTTSNAAVGAGTQFITGACQSDADCASGCCGFNSGKCAGAIIALERDGGCGRGNAQSNDNAARQLGFTGDFTPTTGGSSSASSANTDSQANTNANVAAGSGAASQPSSSGTGAQFITGPCEADADCASACCGFNSGKCAGPVIAQERDGGEFLSLSLEARRPA